MNRKQKLIIYLDTCIYGRVFDWPQTPEIRAEVDAISAIIAKCKKGGHQISGSALVSYEIGQIPDAVAREKIATYYYSIITDVADVTAQDYLRANVLAATAGLGILDSQHLATAESAGVGFLLTVDAKFIKRCNNRNLTTVKVMNPLNFLNGGYL